MKKYQSIFFLFFISMINGFSQTTNQSQQTVQNDFQNFARTESSRNYTGSYLSVFLNKENTVGSRYLFDRWVKGKIVSLQNVVISNDSFLFNYDKVSRILIATPDKQNIIEINLNVVKSFILTDSNDMVFEKMPGINERDFFIEIVKNKDKYSLYKLVKTKFEKANYTTNGIFESGKKYDEFVDEPEYYVIFPGQEGFKKIGLKRKSIKEALVKEEKKVTEYFSNESATGTIDESFVAGLITFLNQ